MAAPKKSKKIKISDESQSAKVIKDHALTPLPVSEEDVSGAPEVSITVRKEGKKISPIKDGDSAVPVHENEPVMTKKPELNEVKTAPEAPDNQPKEELTGLSNEQTIGDDLVSELESNETELDKVNPAEAPATTKKQKDAKLQNEDRQIPEEEINETTTSEVPENGIDIFGEGSKIEDLDLEAAANTPVGQLDLASTIDPETEFADAEIDAAVDEIVAEESDALLEAEDAARNSLAVVEAKPAKPNRLKEIFSLPAVKWGVAFGLVLLFSIICLLPASRYAALNLLGIRSSSTVTVQDSSTRLPIKNVSVSLQGQTATTDQEGKAVFEKLKLGKAPLEIKKRGFGSIARDVVLGWGSNPMPPEGLTATGTVYVLNLKDYPSENPITKAEATSGEFSAKTNDKGEIRLVTEPSDKDAEITIKADGYREEKLLFTVTDKLSRDVFMVPSRPLIYVSKRTGSYNLYQIDADGKNEKLLLESTGKEREDYSILAHQTDNVTAVVSTREGHRNNDGFLLNGLFIVDSSAQNNRISESERIQLIDWIGDNLIYAEVKEGGSAALPNRSKLKSYNYKTYENKELASANYFNEISIFNGSVLYAPSAYAVNIDSVKFSKIKPDGKDQQTVLDKEVWSIVRTGYDSVAFNSQNTWYELKNTGSAVKLSGAPANLRSMDYHDGPNNVSLRTETRDGKGVLLLRDAQGSEKVIATVAGLRQPTRWLSDSTITYRVVTANESAEYVLSLLGGEARKVTDVTNTGGAESYQN